MLEDHRHCALERARSAFERGQVGLRQEPLDPEPEEWLSVTNRHCEPLRVTLGQLRRVLRRRQLPGRELLGRFLSLSFRLALGSVAVAMAACFGARRTS